MPASLLTGVTLTVLVGAVDVSCDVSLVDATYGRTRLWDPASASICQVVMDCGVDHQPPTRGPIGASVVVTLTYGATSRTIFTGTVQRRNVESTPSATSLALDCVDAFERLARVNRRAAPTDVAVGAGDAIDERLDRWLTEADWDGATDLDDSSLYTCPETLLDGTALTELQRTALADGGDFYIAGDGTATFRSWAWRLTVDDVTAIFSDRKLFDWVPYSQATYREDLDELQNHVTGVRRQYDATDPVPQTAVATGSVTTYGERGDPLDDLELEDDAQVATRVDAQVASSSQPAPRFDNIVIQPGTTPSRSWPRVIPIDFGSLIATNRLYPDGSQAALYGNVIGQRWRITPTDASLVLSVSGTGPWDTQRGPRAPIALEYCPDGTLRVPPGLPCDQTSTVLIKDADGNVLAEYPPGSLCECGTVVVPDGGVEVCLDDGVVQICTPINDPRLLALVWLDVLEPGPDMLDRIEGDAVPPGPGFADTTLNAFPGSFDAINANAAGGVIGGSHSDVLQAAGFEDGWEIQFWLLLPTDAEAPGVEGVVVDAGPVRISLEQIFGTSFGFAVAVDADDAATYTTGPIVVPTVDLPQLWNFRWDPDSNILFVRLGGVTVHTEGFAHTPADVSGLWEVALPGDASIGEVLIWGEREVPAGDYDATVVADGPFAYWPLSSEAAPSANPYDEGVLESDPFAYWPLASED